MNKIQFEKLIKPLVGIYNEIELDIIYNILEKLDSYNGVKGSLEWYLDKLKDLGTIDSDTLKMLKKDNKKIKKILLDIANSSARNTNHLDKLEEYYKQGKIEINPIDAYNSVSINNLINEAVKDSNSIMELINTKALEGTKESYMKILNKAYLETASGTYTYTEAIRRALDDFSKEGIRVATYESGKAISIESVIRRDVITRMNKLVGDVEIQHCKDLGTNLVYVDQHLGARVRTPYMKHDYEAHCEWQGKKYMIEGSSDKYPNLYEKTGYGEMLGLKGINCYHDLRPTWEWENIPDRIDEVENAEAYERLQEQRKFERKIRNAKIQSAVSTLSDNPDDRKKARKKLDLLNNSYNKWLEKNDMTRDYNREYIKR